ncbi:hypothetical protein PGT21_005941 [Puccinia graminis f. sp. tritici]|uniref:Uncharacterized protein n=1 Tax=Puccinia graminis f. sp. tritici TaxID=56615 RepID=A0A5B0QHK2_PUCGR|nr:hypothetical protein PGT21_005941 [Puccinia graminis f. sp. tritici]
MTALTNVAKRSEKNKKSFDKKLGTIAPRYAIGESVKLRNESHVKGAPRWYGPFEIKRVLENNVYILSDTEGSDYLRPVNGNSLRPVSLRSLLTNEMWATPPIIALKERQKDARVAKKALRNTKSIAKTSKPGIRLKFEGKFITPKTGTASKIRGGGCCSRRHDDTAYLGPRRYTLDPHVSFFPLFGSG